MSFIIKDLLGNDWGLCMIINLQGDIEYGDRTHVIESQEKYLYYEGFVYIEGFVAGRESVNHFLFLLKLNDIKDVVTLLRGNFFIIIKNKHDNAWVAFTDNNGMFKGYASNYGISTSFLQLVKRQGLNFDDIEPEAIVEFINFGNLFNFRTFFKGINKVAPTAIIFCNDGHSPVALKKNLPEIDGDVNDFQFLHFFEMLAYALSNENISVDVTGGYDSRTIISVFAYLNVKFEMAISGTDEHPDVVISKQIGQILQREIQYTTHQIDIDTMERDMPLLYNLVDGLGDIFNHHRLMQLQSDRQRRGISVFVAGSGDILSDKFWIQDFPFYNSKNTRLERLYDYRIMSIAPRHEYYSSCFSDISKRMREKILNELMNYKLATNTKTYDNIQYRYRMFELTGRSVTNNRLLVDCYTPFLEFDLVRFAFHLPRMKRFMNYYQRDIITRYAPLLANIQTTEGGMSASSKPIDMIVDLRKYTEDKLQRLFRQLARKTIRRNIFTAIANHNDFDRLKRQYFKKEKILDQLIERKILAPRLTIENIEDRYLGKLISLTLFINNIDSDRKSRLISS